MNMQPIAELFRQIVIIVLVVGGVSLAGLLGWLVVHRGLRELRFQHREAIKAKYRPTAETLLHLDPPKDVYLTLVQAPRRYRSAIAELLLAPLRVANGAFVVNLRTALTALGFIDRWFADLSNRRWWVRAEAARALGLVQQADAIDRLIRALDDEHEEVRAAAVEALGTLLDVRAIVPLLEGLADPEKHQRARLISALQAFGDDVTSPVLSYARQRPEHVLVLLNLLEMVGSARATEDLLAWSEDGRPDVRAASLKALGTIGVDDRAYMAAMKGLLDEHADVRAMAARALGRSRRQDAARVLGERLIDEWIVAAHAATALRSLGAAGTAQLETHASDQGQPGDLARQMLWEKQLADAPVPLDSARGTLSDSRKVAAGGAR